MSPASRIIEVKRTDAAGEFVTDLEVRRQLQKMLRSKTFRRASRLRNLLAYVVGNALIGDPADQRRTAMEVFGRTDDFDSTIDPVIRVHFGRLRKLLESYYADEGSADLVRVTIPDRIYTARFSSMAANAHVAPAEEEPEDQRRAAGGGP